MTHKRISLAAASLALPLVSLAATPNVATATESRACVSERGWIFKAQQNNGLILDGVGSPRVFHNGTNHNATVTLSQSGSGTSEWAFNTSTTPSGGIDFQIVKAGVETTFGGSYVRSKTSSGTWSVEITVAPDRYGILQGGVLRRKVAGEYVFDNGQCQFTQRHTLTVKLPKPVEGWESVENTTGNIPWDR